MKHTYKAAYIPDNGSGTGGGIRLTTESAGIFCTDSELLAIAIKEAAIHGLEISENDIVIGDWTE